MSKAKQETLCNTGKLTTKNVKWEHTGKMVSSGMKDHGSHAGWVILKDTE